MIYDPKRFPFVWSDICPDCDTDLVAVVEQTVGTPRAVGGLMKVPFEPQVVWMQSCHHVEDWATDID
jgi:hypothetical protein